MVCVLSGGNNDVSRYAEVVERALVHEGRKHYFLVEFPQEPGALRRFLDEVLGTGGRHHPVRVREAQQPGDRPRHRRYRAGPRRRPGRLLERMAAAPAKCEQIAADSPLFRFLL